jgi:cytochrome b561
MPVSRYSLVAILLHWLVAILILVNLWLGWRYGEATGMAKFDLMQWHKSIGFTVLALSLVRLGWRLINPPPAYPAYIAGWQKRASTAAHWSLYGLMVGLPLTGWAIVSASPTNIPTLLYKSLPWPHIGFIHDLPMATRLKVDALAVDAHHLLVWGLWILLALHLAAIAKHWIIDGDPVLLRMVPGFRKG